MNVAQWMIAIFPTVDALKRESVAVLKDMSMMEQPVKMQVSAKPQCTNV